MTLRFVLVSYLSLRVYLLVCLRIVFHGIPIFSCSIRGNSSPAVREGAGLPRSRRMPPAFPGLLMSFAVVSDSPTWLCFVGMSVPMFLSSLALGRQGLRFSRHPPTHRAPVLVTLSLLLGPALPLSPFVPSSLSLEE